MRRWFKVTNVFVILGIFFIFAGVGNSSSPQGDTSMSIIGGTLFLLGALAYKARITQVIHSSKGWLITEIIAIVLMLCISLTGVTNGNWYAHSISFSLIPIIALAVWFRALSKNSVSK